MSLTRREFLRGLGGVLAAGVAPAFIGSDVLMPVKKIWTGDDTIYVDTIAQLRELTPPYKRVVVRGYYSLGDGGGGLYAWTPSVRDDNGGTVIAAPRGTYEAAVSGPVDVRMFGAQPWASGDVNRDAFQRAIDALGSVQLPATDNPFYVQHL